MKINAYLLIDSDGALQIRKTLPNPRVQQVAVKLSIQIDDSWFERPIISANLVVPNEHVLPAIEVHTEEPPAREFVNAGEQIEDEDGNVRSMTPEEREAWDNR